MEQVCNLCGGVDSMTNWMKSIAPVCGVSEITRGLLKQHCRFDYNPLAKLDLTSISTLFQSYLDDERLCAIKP